MQRNRHQAIDIQAIGQRRDEQIAQGIRQRDLAAIFEEGHGILERRAVGVGSPDLGVVRMASAAVVALMSRAMAEGGR